MGKQRKTKKKTRRDVIEIARDVVEQAIGEQLTGGPLPVSEPQSTNERQSKGGKARMSKLPVEQRRKLAKKAARVRWDRGSASNESE